MALEEKGGFFPEPEKKEELSPSVSENENAKGEKKQPKKPIEEVKPRNGLTRTQEGQILRYGRMVSHYYTTRRDTPFDFRLPIVRRQIRELKKQLKQDP